jgi:hypothetical protein
MQHLLDGLCDDLGRQVRCACGGGSRRAARVAAARSGEMACRIGDLARRCCTAAPATFEPGATFVRQTLCAVEKFDAVSTASWVDSRQAAVRAVGGSFDTILP